MVGRPSISSRDEARATRRFRVLRKIGSGGMGVVYEAFDRERSVHVALKTLKTLDARSLVRFKQEFRALQGVHHPNLVNLGELLEDSGNWFFTMELIRGTDFVSWVRGEASLAGGDDTEVTQRQEDDGATEVVPRLQREMTAVDPPVRVGGSLAAFDEAPSSSVGTAVTQLLLAREDGAPKDPATVRVSLRPRAFVEARLRNGFAQLAQALVALHGAEKIHRDIKPSNVLVTDEGRVVLLDFGLLATREEARAEDDVVGTLGYMAPEQTLASKVGPEADWYSFGVMLYVCLTGTLPHSGARALVLKRKQSGEPPIAPSTFVAGVPADLEALCLSLLEREQSARPDASEVLRVFEVASTPEISSGHGAGAFVGRARELAALEAAFEGTRGPEGRAVTLLVHGESGVGKTALVRRFAQGLEARLGPRALVLFGRCSEWESVPYKALDAAIDGLSRHLERLAPEAVAELLPPRFDLLARVLPVLGRVRPRESEPEPVPVDPQRMRALVFSTLRELFTRVSKAYALVLSIDDLQWADADSMALLKEMLCPPSAPSLLLLATVRVASEGGTPRLGHERLARELPGEIRELGIAPLPPDDARALASRLIRQAAGRADVRLESIALEAGGHPLFIDALVRHGAASGDAIPLRLDEAIWARVLRLDSRARQLAELVAVAGSPIAQGLASKAAALDAVELAKLAATLESANIARTNGPRLDDTIEPFHDRVRASITSHLGLSARREWHARLAVALEQSASLDPELLAFHWAEAGEDVRAAGYAEAAADHAEAALAFAQAAELYRAARAAYRAGTPERRVLEVKLGDALGNAGHGGDAARVFLAAAEGASARESLELNRKAAEQFLKAGFLDEGLAALDVALSGMGLKLPRTPRQALFSLGINRARLRLRGLEFRRRAASEVDPRDLARVDASWAASVGLTMVDYVRGADFQTRTLLLALEVGEPHRVVRALGLEACLVASGGMRASTRVDRLIGAVHDLSEELDDPEGRAWVAAATGVAALQQGRWRDILPACDRAAALFRDQCRGATWEVHTVELFSLWSLWFSGEISELARRMPLAMQEAQDRGDLYATTNLKTGFTIAHWLVHDQPEAAAAHVSDSIRSWSTRGFHLQHFFEMVARTKIDLYLGDPARAYAFLEERWPALESSLALQIQVLSVYIHLLRARTGAAVALQDPARASEVLSGVHRDLRKIEREGMPWSKGLVELVRATVALAERRSEAAVHYLECAEPLLREERLMLYHAASQRRRGERIGGEAGAKLVDQADRWMRDRGVARPELMASVLVPMPASSSPRSRGQGDLDRGSWESWGRERW